MVDLYPLNVFNKSSIISRNQTDIIDKHENNQFVFEERSGPSSNALESKSNLKPENVVINNNDADHADDGKEDELHDNSNTFDSQRVIFLLKQLYSERDAINELTDNMNDTNV